MTKENLIPRLFGKELSEVIVTDPSRILAIAPYHLLREHELVKLLQEGVFERKEIYINVSKNKLYVELAKLSGELKGKFGYCFDEKLLAEAIVALRGTFTHRTEATIYYAKYLHPLLVVFDGSTESTEPVLLIAPRIEE